jgi:hypothetical protein
VWVSEFGFTGTVNTTPATAWSNLSRFIKWMEGNGAISRYAIFAARIGGHEPWADPRPKGEYTYHPMCRFMDGGLTYLGDQYRQVPGLCATMGGP